MTGSTARHSNGFAIRKAELHDEGALLDICVRTSDQGRDGRHLYTDQDYPGLIWVSPYLHLCSEHCFVLVHDSSVVGYAVGTSDTDRFEASMEKHWWPDIRRRFEGAHARTDADSYVLGYFRDPERISTATTSSYPAHLHINLLEEAQGKGLGRALIEKITASFESAGAIGVHLGVNALNEGVTAFYQKLGFKEINRTPSIVMAKNLNA
jgi:ribosomal protein S18 acetylase RimI-like enzyme